MYRQKMYSTDATQMPTNALSLDDFKAFHDAHVSQGNERWQKMEENDGKRRSRFLNARGDYKYK